MDAETLQRAHGEMRAAYWERKDLDEVVRLGRASIAGAAGVTAVEVRGWVKAIAYDLASFTWPGWDEPGLEITPDHLHAGAEAAALNLDLAVSLERPPDKVAMAHWMVGAHHLAAGERGAARAAFAEAEAFAAKAGDRPQELLARGYAAIAGTDAAGLEEAKGALASVEDGAAYVAQLETAARVFA